MHHAFYIVPIVMAIAGLFIGRWNGGGRPKWLKWLDNPFSQMLYAYPIALILAASVPGMVHTFPNYLSNWHIFMVYAFTVIMLVKGHGRNMDLGTSDANKPDAVPEWYEGIIIGLYGKIPNYWYDALGLVISGLTYMAPAALYLANPLILAIGVVKAPAYMLGKLLYDWKPEFFHRPKLAMDGFTAYGEAFTCAGIHFFLGLILMRIVENMGFLS